MQSDSTTNISGMKGWANKLSVLRSFLTNVLLICLFLAGLVFVVAEFRRDHVVIDPIELPTELSDTLSTNVGITRQLVDAANKIAQHKQDHEGSYRLALLQSSEQENTCEEIKTKITRAGKNAVRKCSEARSRPGHFSRSTAVGIKQLTRLASEEPDIEIPAFGSLRSTVRLLKATFGFHETHITGEITKKGEKMQLVLRSSDPNAVQPEPIVETSDTQELIKNGGKALIQLHSPCVTASYYYREELDKGLDRKNFSKTIRLIEPCQRESEYFADFISGLVAYEDNEYIKAIEHFQRAIDKNPKSPDAYFHLGRVLRKIDKPYEAKLEYDKAINIDQNYVDAYGGLAFLLIDKGQPDEAVKVLQNLQGLIDRNPQRAADIYVSWGNVLLYMKKLGDAGKKYGEAIKIQKNQVVAYNNWGVALYSESNYLAAMDKYKEAFALDQRYRDAYYNYGMAMIELSPEKNKENRFREAIRLYQDAIKRDPKFTLGHFFSGIAKLRLAILVGNRDQSKKFANGAQENFKDFKKSMDQETKEKSADLFNHWGNSLLLLARHSSVSGKRAKGYRKNAIEAYNTAINLATEPETYYYPYINLAIAYFLLDDKSKADELYNAGTNARAKYDERYERTRSNDNKQVWEIPAANTTPEPESLIWPWAAGGLAILLTGLLLITLKNMRKAKPIDTAKTPHLSQPSRPTAGSVPRRQTQIKVDFPPPAPLQPTAILRYVDGATHNRRFSMEKEAITIGANAENDLCIADDDYASGYHAHLQYEDGELFIRDQGSRNGTLVNGERLSDTALALKPGDRIQIGMTTFEVLLA